MAFFSPPSTGGMTPGAPGAVRNTMARYPANPQNKTVSQPLQGQPVAAQPGLPVADPGASTGQDQVMTMGAPGQPQPTRQDQFNAWRDQLRGLNNSGIEAGAMPPSWLGDARAQRVQNRIMGRPTQKAGQPGGEMPVGVPY